ncbi:MAG: PD-(D/E)XK nuclease family protein [Actinomycetota bacterium]
MSFQGASNVVKLAPSDLTFLWEECRRCFWLKVKGVLKRPSSPFPKVFSLLDSQTKDYFANQRTDRMASRIKPGVVSIGDRWVRSSPLEVPGHETRVVLQGKIDTALSFDDGTFGIIDFKTTEPKPMHVPFYGRQLHSYALAAENPAEGALRLAPVTQIGLLCVQPVAMIGVESSVAYKGATHFLDIDRDDEAFEAFLAQVVGLLEQARPPDQDQECSFCSYLAEGALVSLTGLFGGLT